MYLRNAGTQLPDYAAPQRTISILKSMNYLLVEIINVKMGSTCSLEILRCISIRKAIKLYVDIAFLPQSFRYKETY